MAALVDLGVGLGDGVVIFFIGRHVKRLLGEERLHLHFGQTRLADGFQVLLR
jgi:hypothetical protein